jgi:hypothetical protein
MIPDAQREALAVLAEERPAKECRDVPISAPFQPTRNQSDRPRKSKA